MEKGHPQWGGLVGSKTTFRGRSGDESIVIREHHAFRDTCKERCDLVLISRVFRSDHSDDCDRRFPVEEAGEQCEISVLSRGQRLKGADVFGVNSVELVSARTEFGKRVRPKGEAALFDASLTNSTRCSCDDPLRLAGAVGIGAERRLRLEEEISFDGHPEAAPNGADFAEAYGANFRKAKAKIADTVCDIRVLRIGFAEEPGGTGVRCEELDHRVMVDDVLTSFNALLVGAAIGGQLVEDGLG